jgi:hypothetical protein
VAKDSAVLELRQSAYEMKTYSATMEQKLEILCSGMYTHECDACHQLRTDLKDTEPEEILRI